MILGMDSETTFCPPEVNIWSVGDLLNVLGSSPDARAEWRDRYGFDSRGIGSDGTMLLPEFPMLVKILDAIVDAVIFMPHEADILVEECNAAAKRQMSQELRETFLELAELCNRAAQQGKRVWIGGG